MDIKKIIWKDIAGVTPADEGSWMSLTYVQSEGRVLFEREYVTVGRVVVDEPDYIIIAATWDDSDKTYSDVSMIPRGVIVDILDLIE